MSLTKRDYMMLAESIAATIIRLQKNNPKFNGSKFIDKIREEVNKDGSS